MSNELIDITLNLHAKTEKAILVSDDGEPEHALWLPLSQCEFTILKGSVIEVTMPEWLAQDKGLI